MIGYRFFLFYVCLWVCQSKLHGLLNALLQTKCVCSFDRYSSNDRCASICLLTCIYFSFPPPPVLYLTCIYYNYHPKNFPFTNESCHTYRCLDTHSRLKNIHESWGFFVLHFFLLTPWLMIWLTVLLLSHLLFASIPLVWLEDMQCGKKM